MLGNHEKKILLIEDNSDEAILTIRALEKVELEFKLILAKSGSEALDLISKQRLNSEPCPDVILLDLNLPEVSGFDILEEIKSSPKCKHIPVVVLTSSREENDIRKCVELGANSYIQKPTDFLEFVEVAELIGKYWLLTNETI